MIKYENIYENGLLTEVRCVTCKSNELNNDITRRLNYKDGLLQSVVHNNGKVDTYNYENNKLKSIDYNNGNKTVFEYKGDKIDKELKYLKNGVCKDSTVQIFS